MSFNDFYTRGVENLNNSNFDRAINYFTDALKRKPDLQHVYLYRAKTYLLKKDRISAKKDLEKAIKLNPKFSIYAVIKHEKAYELSKRDKEFDENREINPNDSGSLIQRGKFQSSKGNYRKAIKDFDKAIYFNPKDRSVFIHRGIAYYFIGNNDQAKRDFDTAIKLSSLYPHSSALIGRALVYLNKENYGHALKNIDLAIESYTKLGIQNLKTATKIYLSHGRYEEVIKASNDRIKYNPEDFGARTSRGIAYYYEKNLDNAIEDFNEVLKSPGRGKKVRAKAYYYRGLAYQDKLDYDLAIADFKKCDELDPNKYPQSQNLVKKLKRKIAKDVQEIRDRIDKGDHRVPDSWENRKVRTSTKVFREITLENFEGVCCVCGLDEESILEAAHIKSWSSDENNRLNPRNGLCLCRNHHKFFEDGYFEIDSSLRIKVNKKVTTHLS